MWEYKQTEKRGTFLEISLASNDKRHRMIRLLFYPSFYSLTNISQSLLLMLRKRESCCVLSSTFLSEITQYSGDLNTRLD